jgi:sugar phosphate isomerase/epimerase
MKSFLYLNSKSPAGLLSFMLLMLVAYSCNSGEEPEFLADIGICTGPDNTTVMADAGYTYFEGGVQWLLVPEDPDEKFDSIFRDVQEAALPVRACNSFLPGRLKSVGPEAVHDKILAYAETAFKRAQMLGIETIVFGSGGSRSVPEGFPADSARQQFIALLKKMGPVAGRYDVTVVLEPLNKKEVNFLNSVKEGAGIVEEVDHPNIRLLADIYHMMMEDEGPESILEHGHLIKHLHIAEEEGRAAPGTHKEDFVPYFRALKEIGYKGRISIEGRWEDLATQAPTAIAYIHQQKSLLN